MAAPPSTGAATLHPAAAGHKNGMNNSAIKPDAFLATPAFLIPGYLAPGPCPAENAPVSLGATRHQVPVLPYIENVEMALAKGVDQPLTFHRRVMLPLRSFLPAVLNHLRIQACFDWSRAAKYCHMVHNLKRPGRVRERVTIEGLHACGILSLPRVA
jgi:hypothetical protein